MGEDDQGDRHFNRLKALLLRVPVWLFVPLMTLMSYVAVLPLDWINRALGLGLRFPDPTAGQSMALQIVLLIFIAPLFETGFAQWIPIKLSRHFRVSRLGAAFISATIFGAMHPYSVGYVIATFVIGLVLAWSFFLSEDRKESAYWNVTAIHAQRNAAALTYRTLAG